MKRLSTMNGWQRLWFAGTILALIVCGVIYPVLEMGSKRDFSYSWSIEEDYKNPACSRFINAPFEQLEEPSYGKGVCWHIYTSRKYEPGYQSFPTYEDWYWDNEQEYWLNVAALGALFAVAVLIVSAITYGLGVTIGWILKGFRQPQP